MKQYGLIGGDLSYSYSKDHFEKKFITQNLKDHYYYNFELASIGEIPKLLETHPHLKGFNVTNPFKQAIIPYLDGITDAAAAMNAVNCVRIFEGKCIGYNTDYIGFLNSLLPQLTGPIKALVFGSGGASKAVCFALKSVAIPYKIVARKQSANSISFQEANRSLLRSHCLWINTTPLGTAPNVNQHIPIDLDALSPEHLVYDLVYNPPKTALLKAAQKAGSSIINGAEMLKIQAEKSWEIWSF